LPRPIVREQRREQIIRATLRLIRKVGVHGFTISDVADEAGVSRGILHYHCQSKEEIIREALLLLLLEFGRRGAEAAAAAGGAARARLHALIDAAMSEDQVGFYATLLEFWPPARRLEAHRAVMARLYDGWIVFISGIIRRAVASGELTRPIARPEDLACALVALHDGLMVQRLIRGDWMPTTRARDIVRAVVDNWFR
jgi:TetR/AcrR family transcriptional regulator, transcriptional repressor of bet genes